MAAAALTVTSYQKERGQVQDFGKSTTVNVVTYRFKVTKATQNDTVDVNTQLGIETSNVINMTGITIPTGGDAVQETMTIDDSEDDIVLTSATVGTTWVTLEVQE